MNLGLEKADCAQKNLKIRNIEEVFFLYSNFTFHIWTGLATPFGPRWTEIESELTWTDLDHPGPGPVSDLICSKDR